ncbi:MAG: hypothetical protein ACJ790_22965 [Myxococcaceae bacterium]
MTATWRDWQRAQVCDVDPHTLQGELDSMRVLLAEFLGQTSAGFDGMWGDEHLELLEAAQKELPPALDGTDAAVAKVQACAGFDNLAPDLPGLEELLKQARHRLADAPLLLPYARAKRQVQAWKDAQPKAQVDAKEQVCPAAKKSKQPVVYYAAERRFFFCDGAAVTLSGEKPTVEQKKKFADTAYVDAAKNYPAAQIARPPPLPPKSRDTGDQDKFDLNEEIK